MEWYPRRDSNPRTRLRRPVLYPTELRGQAYSGLSRLTLPAPSEGPPAPFKYTTAQRNGALWNAGRFMPGKQPESGAGHSRCPRQRRRLQRLEVARLCLTLNTAALTVNSSASGLSLDPKGALLSDRKPLDIRLIEKPRDFVHRQILLTAQNFARIEASSGLALMAAALVALIWANSPWDDAYLPPLDTHISIDANIVHLDLSLKHWINDGLMVLFFFLMGLEIKREMVHGELSSFRRAILPVTAAMGGMIAPALIYTAINS